MTFGGEFIPEIISVRVIEGFLVYMYSCRLVLITITITIPESINTHTLNMANISTPIPELKLNDGTSIPMLAYGSKPSSAALIRHSNDSQLALPGISPVPGVSTSRPSRE